MKIVLDTNVFISAIIFGGNPGKIIEAALDRDLTIFCSSAILLETSQILKTKFNWSSGQIREAISFLAKLCQVVKPQKTIKKIKADPKDNRILECAKEAKVNFIVSGDKRHLLFLKKFGNIPILSPAEFLTRIFYAKTVSG